MCVTVSHTSFVTTVKTLIGYALTVSLTSGLPMVRQGLRSLQNGRASIPHYPPPSPKSREAERPGSLKAERRKPGKPGAEKAEMPIVLRSGRSDKTSCAFTFYYRYATMPYGMPRHRGGHVILCSLLNIFQSKLRVCLTHPPSHSNGHILKKRNGFHADPFGTRVRKVSGPKVGQSLV